MSLAVEAHALGKKSERWLLMLRKMLSRSNASEHAVKSDFGAVAPGRETSACTCSIMGAQKVCMAGMASFGGIVLITEAKPSQISK